MQNQWRPISSVPAGRDVQLCVIEKGEVHALAFPCQLLEVGWINSMTRRPVEINPTHWREWDARRTLS